MGLNYKCPECGTALGFEGLCWSCRAKHHREEVNNWSLQEIEEKKKQVIEKLKVTEDRCKEIVIRQEMNFFHLMSMNFSMT